MKNKPLSIILIFIFLLFLAHCTEGKRASDSSPKGDFKTMREKMVETQIKAEGSEGSSCPRCNAQGRASPFCLERLTGFCLF